MHPKVSVEGKGSSNLTPDLQTPLLQAAVHPPLSIWLFIEERIWCTFLKNVLILPMHDVHTLAELLRHCPITSQTDMSCVAALVRHGVVGSFGQGVDREDEGLDLP